jgi:hypothetical protein
MGRRWLLGCSAAAALVVLAVSGYRIFEPSDSDQGAFTSNSCTPSAAGIIPPAWRSTYMNPPNIYHTALFSDAARTGVLAVKSAPVPPFFKGSLGTQRKLLGEGRLFVMQKKPAPVIDEIDWSITDHGQSYATELHALSGIGRVLLDPQPMSEPIAASVSAALRNWSVCVAHNPAISERAWFEGTVVKRLSTLLAALNYMRAYGAIPGFDYEGLIYLIDLHINYLLDTQDIYTLSNHGLRQDIMLAAAALHLPMHPRAAEMLRITESRLNAGADSLFTKEGVWLEHAPGYVQYAVRLMLDVKTLDDANDQFNPHKFLDRLHKSADYLVKSLTPEATIPWIGSSAGMDIVPKVKQHLLAVGGKSIEQQLADLSNSVQVFQDYGHVIVRGRHPDGLYLIFVAAQNLPADKRHADELSFILYNYGRLWITEGGHQDYEVTGMTRYLRSPRAHNNYMLGDDYILEDKSPELDAYIKSVETDRFGTQMVGFTERFPVQASAERRLKVDATYSSIAIQDRLQTADTKLPWRGRLHFPPDLAVEVSGTQISVKDLVSSKILRIKLTADQPVHFERYSGQEKPVRGWGMSQGSLQPITTIEYTLQRSGTLAMDLQWE